MIAPLRSDRPSPLLIIPFMALFLTACAPETEAPPAPTVDATRESALVEEAAVALERYCIGGLPDIEAVAIAMSADSGADTGKAYTPYEGPEGFVGASLRAADGFSANTARKSDGRIVCGVALFTPMRGEFETAILDRLVQENGLQVRGPRNEPDNGVAYALEGFVSPATLSFRTRQNSAGEAAIGAVITVAEDGGALPLTEPIAPAEVAAVTPQEPTQPETATPAAPVSASAQTTESTAEPTAPARPTIAPAPAIAAPPPQVDAVSATPEPAPAAAPTPAPQVAAAPAQPARPTPTLPRAANPPALGVVPSLYEGASYAAFTPQQIAEFCQQDWRTRRKPGGRTEYNPCHERGAFR